MPAININRFLSHSELPQPILFKEVDTSLDHLQEFLDMYSHIATRFTIDDDHVGRTAVCAFLDTHIQGVMVYSRKDRIKNYMIQQGFHCTLDTSNPKAIIQCHKILKQ